MFGIGARRRERKLRQRGVPAMAMVLATQRKLSGVYKTNDPFYQSAPVQATPDLWALRVRVEPHGEPAFDATVEAWLYEAQRPWLNTVVPVLYDPSDHSKVALDSSDEARQAAQQATFAMREEQRSEQARSPVERLTELMQLRDSGSLTEAEYLERKQKLLGQ